MAKTADSDSKQEKASVKKVSKPSKPSKPGLGARFIGYLRGVRSEMKRVVWPTRKEVINSSVVVIVTLLFFIAVTLILDQIISFLLFNVVSKIG